MSIFIFFRLNLKKKENNFYHRKYFMMADVMWIIMRYTYITCPIIFHQKLVSRNSCPLIKTTKLVHFFETNHDQSQEKNFRSCLKGNDFIKRNIVFCLSWKNSFQFFRGKKNQQSQKLNLKFQIHANTHARVSSCIKLIVWIKTHINFQINFPVNIMANISRD